jgi:PAS domain S-box-containing protein
MLFLLLVVVLGAEGRARMLAEQRGEALLATESRFRALFEKAPLGMAIVESVSGRYLAVNDGLSRILGYSPEELLRRSFMSVTHPESLEDAQRDTQELDSGEIDDYRKEKKFIHKDGRTILARLHVVRLPGVPPESTRHLSIVEDITEARRQEEELLASEKRLRGIIDLSPDPISLSRMSDGVLMMVNPAWCDLTGISAEEALGRSSTALGMWVNPQEHESALAELRQDGQIGSRDAALQHRDGTVRQTIFTARILNIANEDLALVIAKDVTDRQRVEAALRESEARFRAMFEKSLSIMLILDPADGSIVEANPAAVKFYGWTREQLRNKKIQEINNLPWEAVREAMAQARSEEKNHFRFTQRLATGELREVETFPSPIEWSGRPLLFAFVHDVTQRIQLEKALKENEAQLRMITDNVGDVIWAMDLDPPRLVFVSPSVFQLLGMTPEQALQAAPEKPFTPEAADKVRRFILERVAAFRADDPATWAYMDQLDQVRSDGTVVPTEVRTRCLADEQGRPVRIIGVSRDISDRIRAEASLREAQALARLGSWELDLVTGKLSWSEEVFRIFEIDPGKFGASYEAFLSAIHPEDRELVDRTYRHSLEEHQDYVIRHRLLFPEGRVKHVIERGKSFFSPEGRPLRSLGTVQDVTDQVQAEQALQASESRLRILADQLPDIFVFQYVGAPGEVPRFTYISAGVERLCGLEPEAVLRDAARFLGQIDPASLPAYLEAESVSRRDLSPFAMDLRQRRADGEWRWFRVRSTPRGLADGSVAWEGISTDVTDQKQGHLILAESENRFRNLANCAPVMIWMASPDKASTWFNQGWLNWTGRSQEQEIGEGWTAGIHPDDRPFCLGTYVRSFDARQPFDREFRLRHHSGAYRWILDRGTPRFAEDGAFLGYVGACSDIHDQKAALDALRESEARFRIVAEESPVPLFLHRDGRFLYLNPAAVHILRAQSPEELVGRPVLDLVHPADRERVVQRMQNGQEREQPAPLAEERFYAVDGTLLEVEVQARPVQFEGRPAVLVFAQDITERKRTIEALRESETRFRSVVENAVDAIFVNDMAGRILLCNREACRSTGYSQDELLRLRVGDLAPELSDAAQVEALRALAIGKQLTFDGKIRRKNGTTFPAEVHIGLLSEEEPRRILAMARNLSEREQARESEHRARKAESLVLMAGGIAHDFNNLFQAVLSNMEIAELLAGKLESVREPIGQAKEVLRKAVSLSWKMLDFSGRGIVHLQPLDLGPWLEQFRAALEPGLPPSFRLELECEPVPGIDGDPSKLEQVLKAAVDNALEAAGPGGGCVRLRLFTDFGPGQPGPQSPGIWPIERPKGPASVCLEIADDGPGVPLERLGLVCDPFYTTKEPGRGLGLAAAVGILNAHGAGLRLLNGEGKGLILRLHFPPSGA